MKNFFGLETSVEQVSRFNELLEEKAPAVIITVDQPIDGLDPLLALWAVQNKAIFIKFSSSPIVKNRRLIERLGGAVKQWEGNAKEVIDKWRPSGGKPMFFVTDEESFLPHLGPGDASVRSDLAIKVGSGEPILNENAIEQKQQENVFAPEAPLAQRPAAIVRPKDLHNRWSRVARD